MRFIAHIENGKLALNTPEAWKRYLLGFKDRTELVMDIDRKKNTRSLSQNRYYWLYLNVIETETGNDANDLHELFKRLFLPSTDRTILGTSIRLPASTTELSKHDFSEYMEKICAMTQVPIPDPSLAGYESNYKTIKDEQPKVAYPTEFEKPLL